MTSKDWPILESTGVKPAGWSGWPENKRFAFVLTHDVEGPLGLDRCKALVEMEARLGFRSSFNFIPEGGYVATKQFRDGIARDGFEIGVHDLRHDGLRYRSREAFAKAAARINEYLGDWGAVGFRAGFMFHNLEWLKLLAIEYDASTFDTDPFEPQPDGGGTIFPFWVAGHQPGAGYVELPYTLPQDATMFLVLRHQTIDIWKTKVDWLAAQGGMALLNVHPDYMAFGGGRPSASEFNPASYEEFLKYVKHKYAGAYWHALPSEVARFYRKQQAEPAAAV